MSSGKPGCLVHEYNISKMSNSGPKILSSSIASSNPSNKSSSAASSYALQINYEIIRKIIMKDCFRLELCAGQKNSAASGGSSFIAVEFNIFIFGDEQRVSSIFSVRRGEIINLLAYVNYDVLYFSIFSVTFIAVWAGAQLNFRQGMWRTYLAFK